MEMKQQMSVSERANHLHNIYTSLKGWYEGNQFRRKSRNPMIITTFHKIAEKLISVERESGLEIKDWFYVLSAFRKHGVRTYPAHLLGGQAMRIYHEEMEQVFIKVATPKKDIERELLKYLSGVRRETEEETIDALKDAGVFSRIFIQEWEKGKRKRR